MLLVSVWLENIHTFIILGAFFLSALYVCVAPELNMRICVHNYRSDRLHRLLHIDAPQYVHCANSSIVKCLWLRCRQVSSRAYILLLISTTVFLRNRLLGDDNSLGVRLLRWNAAQFEFYSLQEDEIKIKPNGESRANWVFVSGKMRLFVKSRWWKTHSIRDKFSPHYNKLWYMSVCTPL